MKTKEELNALKEEVETLNKKLAELSDDELKEVTGGSNPFILDNVNDLNILAEIVNHCDSTVKDEDLLKEMKLPDFNL